LSNGNPLTAEREHLAKLQDTVGAAMRHAALLRGEATTPFLRVMALFEKIGVLSSIDNRLTVGHGVRAALPEGSGPASWDRVA
jgi:hypothetical protein